jgi:hypothetical protein
MLQRRPGEAGVRFSAEQQRDFQCFPRHASLARSDDEKGASKSESQVRIYRQTQLKRSGRAEYMHRKY